MRVCLHKPQVRQNTQYTPLYLEAPLRGATVHVHKLTGGEVGRRHRGARLDDRVLCDRKPGQMSFWHQAALSE